MKRLIFIGCLSYLLTGFTHVILGAVLPELLQHYHASYSDGGRIVFAEFAGFLGGVLIAPKLAGALGRRRMLLLAAALLGAAETGLSLLPPWDAAMGLAGTAGFGFGLTEAGIGTFVLIAAREKQAVAMSRLEVFFGLGALVMPFVSSFLISLGLWRLSFLVLGLSALAMMPVWARLSFGELDPLLAARRGGSGAAGQAAAGISRAASRYGARGGAVLGLFILIFFCYVGAEVAMVNYLPSVFTDKLALSSSAATLSVTVYWLAMVLGRLAAGSVAETVTYRRFMLGTTAGTVAALVALALTSSLAAAFTLVLASGLLMAGMFAVALIYANRLLPPSLTERTTSLLIASGGLGGALLPLLVGRTMDDFGASAAVWSFAAAMLLMLALLIAASGAAGGAAGSAASGAAGGKRNRAGSRGENAAQGDAPAEAAVREEGI
jgi:FHS family glucose/mannose:H+ symporter-like MFS transporter